MSDNRFTRQLALWTVLVLAGATLFAPLGNSATLISDEHRGLAADENDGATVPGEWGKLAENTRFYMRSDVLTPPAGASEDPSFSTFPQGSELSDGRADYEVPVNDIRIILPIVGHTANDESLPEDKRVVISHGEIEPPENDPVDATDGAAHFLPPGDLATGTTEDVRIYEIDAFAAATCTTESQLTDAIVGAGTASGVGIELRIWQYTADGDRVLWETLNLQASDTGSGAIGQTAFAFTAEETFGDAFAETGKLLETGSSLEFEYIPDTEGATCLMHYDSIPYDTHVDILSDSARIATWNEDADGDFTEALPEASRAAASERRFSTVIAHASAWPAYNDYNHSREGSGDYLDRYGWRNDELRFRIRDLGNPQDDREPALDPFVDGTQGRDSQAPESIKIINPRCASPFQWDDDHRSGEQCSSASPAYSNDGVNGLSHIRKLPLPTRVADNMNIYELQWAYPPSLPNGDYRVEVYHTSDFGLVSAPTVTVGLKGIDLDVVGSATHEINLGEPTEFRFTARNIGAESDTVKITVTEPGSNWDVDIDDTSHFLGANGGESTFTVTLTPPSTATTALTKSVTVTALSQNFDELDPVSDTVTAQIVSEVVRDVEVDADFSGIDIAPGQEVRVTGVRVTNLGTAQDNFLMQPSVAAGNPGWIVKAVPPSVSPKAGSIADVDLIIQAPLSATAGTEVALSLEAVRVGDATVSDTMVLTMLVDRVQGLLVETDPTEFNIRTHGVKFCDGEEAGDNFIGLAGPDAAACSGTYTEDRDADDSAIFKIVLHNPSASPDTFTLRQRWTTGTDNSGSCNDGSGSPDWWRVRFGDAAAITEHDVFNNGNRHIDTAVPVPAQSTVVRYIQVGYLLDTPYSYFLGSCAEPAIIASEVGMEIVIQSTEDPSVVSTVNVAVDRVDQQAPVGPNDYPGTVNDVRMELPSDGATSSKGVQADESVSHRFEVRNTGNEFDDILVTVQQDASGDFTRSLDYVGSVPSSGVCTSQNSDDTRWRCDGMGVQDVAFFDLVIEADEDTLVGERDVADVRAVSVSDGSKIDSLRFTTDVVGEFLFSGTGLVANKDVRRDETVLLPFAIRNLGTADDTYTVSLLQADADYLPRLTDTSVFVPAGKNHFGSLSVTVPAAAPIDEEAVFLLRIASQGDPGRQANVGFTTQVVPTTSLTVAGDPDNIIDIVERGEPTQFTVTATDPDRGGSDTVDFTRSTVPLGWSITNVTSTEDVAFDDDDEASVTYEITVPDDALASSRLPVHIVATSSADKSDGTDIVFRLADTYGLAAERIDEETGAIVPGGELAYQVRLTNQGLSADTVLLNTTSITEEGWTVQFDPAQVNLGPLESRIVDVLVDAPSTAPANQTVAFSLLAQSQNDPSAQVQVPFEVTVGTYDLELIGLPTGNVTVAPGSTGSFVFTVNNTGNLADQVSASALLDSVAYEDASSLTVTPATFDLDPGQSRDVLVGWSVDRTIPSDVDLSATFSFESLLAPTSTPVIGSAVFDMATFRYAATDADNDGIDEFAVDRDQDTGNGFESFLDLYDGTGKRTTLANLPQFLTDEARESFNVQVTNATGDTVTVFRFIIDGDDDGRVDHILDDDGDGLPDQYWDPDRGLVSPMDTFRDVDRDQVPDYFVDLDGDGPFDVVYLLSQGRFVPLLQVYVDDDEILDYVVDANENGELDAEETVLLSRDGGLVAVQKIDITDNERLDSVFDVDGDGIPDYFIPAGSEDRIEIVLRDVDGDGEQDWTYDADGDGKRESYYSPTTQESGLIDSEGVFLDSLGEYWYVGAIFGVVLVLFVILMAVTRR